MSKRTVAKLVGASVVGVGGGFAIKKVLGAAVAESLVGAVLLMFLHEVADAPVSDWVYKRI